MSYTPDPKNPHPQGTSQHWIWYHANDPRAKKPRPKTDQQKRTDFWRGKI